MDEVVRDTDPDFSQTGLKMTSLIRITRVAVVTPDILEGVVGRLSEDRLQRIRTRLANWIERGIPEPV